MRQTTRQITRLGPLGRLHVRLYRLMPRRVQLAWRHSLEWVLQTMIRLNQETPAEATRTADEALATFDGRIAGVLLTVDETTRNRLLATMPPSDRMAILRQMARRQRSQETPATMSQPRKPSWMR